MAMPLSVIGRPAGAIRDKELCFPFASIRGPISSSIMRRSLLICGKCFLLFSVPLRWVHVQFWQCWNPGNSVLCSCHRRKERFLAFAMTSLSGFFANQLVLNPLQLRRRIILPARFSQMQCFPDCFHAFFHALCLAELVRKQSQKMRAPQFCSGCHVTLDAALQPLNAIFTAAQFRLCPAQVDTPEGLPQAAPDSAPQLHHSLRTFMRAHRIAAQLV